MNNQTATKYCCETFKNAVDESIIMTHNDNKVKENYRIKKDYEDDSSCLGAIFEIKFCPWCGKLL